MRIPGFGQNAPRRSEKSQEERDTDTAMHELEMGADRPLPQPLLEHLRDLARALGIPESFVQR